MFAFFTDSILFVLHRMYIYGAKVCKFCVVVYVYMFTFRFTFAVYSRKLGLVNQNVGFRFLRLWLYRSIFVKKIKCYEL